MADLTNELRWSRTRDEIFRECLRKYWFQYYGSWNGWKADAPEETRRIYVLKQLQSRLTWAGDRVHRCIATAIANRRRGIEPLGPEAAIDLTIQEMRRDFLSSRKKYYRSRPKSPALFEHEYDVPVTNAEWKATADHVASCLRNFYTSSIWERVLSLPKEAILETEEFGSFPIDDLEVVVSLDLALRAGDRIEIYDWRTGRSQAEESRLVLGCYAAYAMRKWNVPLEAIETCEVDLVSKEVFPFRTSAAELAGVFDYIRGSARDMKLLLTDSEKNLADPDRFPLTENLVLCRTCNFKRLCGR